MSSYLCGYAALFADLRPVILEGMEARQESSGSASSWSLSAIDEAVSRVRLSLDEAASRVQHLSSLDFSASPRVVREATRSSAAVGGGGSRTRLQVSLTQLTHESSIDQESSQLSQDSSNGSISQTEELNEELSLGPDSSFRHRTSPTASTPLGSAPAPLVATPPSVSASSGRPLGTSVIVGGRTETSGDGSRSQGSTALSPGERTISEGQYNYSNSTIAYAV